MVCSRALHNQDIDKIHFFTPFVHQSYCLLFFLSLCWVIKVWFLLLNSYIWNLLTFTWLLIKCMFCFFFFVISPSECFVTHIIVRYTFSWIIIIINYNSYLFIDKCINATPNILLTSQPWIDLFYIYIIISVVTIISERSNAYWILVLWISLW